jgi:exopolysaccharide biosynthesis polyprenyl glycosylphosphotransferase
MSLIEQTLPRQIRPAEASAGAVEARPRVSMLRRFLVAVDVAAITIAWLAALAFVPGGGLVLRSARVAVVVTVSVAVVAGQRLYRSRVCSSRLVETARLVRVAVASSAAGVMVLRLSDGPNPPGPLIGGGALTLVLLVVGRAFYDAWVRAERAHGRFTRPVAVIGSGEEAGRVIELLRHHPELGYRVCGVIGSRTTALANGIAFLSHEDGAVAATVASGATGVVIASHGFAPEELNELVRDLLVRGLHVRLSSGLWRMDHRRLQVMPLAHEPFLYLEPATLSRSQLFLKRVMDVTLASVVLLLTAPCLLAAALAVKLGDGGPVLFRQTRVGRGGRTFTLLKFRTMVVDAEDRASALQAANQRQGPLFKIDSDPRVTRVGQILRATSVDELPQLFNVLHGSMSLVGPRPALPEEVAHFDDDLLDRHQVAPGVTGLWQVEARDNTSFYAYRHLDLFYVENWSCALDLVVLASTIPAVATRAIRSALGRGELATEVGS